MAKENPGAVDAGVQPRKLDTTTDRFHRSGGGRQLRRRRIRWLDDYPALPLTDHQLDAATAAARLLLAHQLPPLFAVETIRALWRRDRALGHQLAQIAGVL